MNSAADPSQPVTRRASLFTGLALLLIALPNLAVLDRFWAAYAQVPTFAQHVPPGLLTGAHALVALAYLFAVLALFGRCDAWLRAVIEPRPMVRRGLLVALFAAFAALTLVAYPMLDSQGLSSDRDEALDVGVRQMLAGGNPYDCFVVPLEHHACLPRGNPIGPLPGALLLAMPFVLLGYGALQSVLWIGLFGWRLLRLSGSRAAGTATLAVLSGAAPILAVEVAAGGDLLANAIWIALGFQLLVQRPKLDALAWLLIVLLGVGLAGRSHFLLITPLLGMVWVRRFGWRRALAASAVMASVFFALALWFYPGHAEQFGPLQVQQKLRLVAGPVAQGVVLGLSAAASVLAAVMCRQQHHILLAAAAVLALPALGAVLLYNWTGAGLGFTFYGWYLLSALPLAVMAWVQSSAAQRSGG